MPLIYRTDILKELKSKGYTTTRLREEKLLSEGVIQKLRDFDTSLAVATLSKVCDLLDCDIGDILKRVRGDVVYQVYRSAAPNRGYYIIQERTRGTPPFTFKERTKIDPNLTTHELTVILTFMDEVIFTTYDMKAAIAMMQNKNLQLEKSSPG